jgi:hypothetical protein
VEHVEALRRLTLCGYVEALAENVFTGVFLILV